MWGAIASIGGSLISGLFGSKKQKTTNTVDYQALVRNAEAAGFNPLTALRAGGAAGHTVTTHPALSSVGEAIGGALQTAGNVFDQRRAERDKYDLLKAQLGDLDNTTASKSVGSRNSHSFDVPVRKASQAVAAGGVSGAPMPPEAGDVTVTNPWQSMHVNPDNRDAAAFEERYGDSEIFQTFIGAKNLVGDAIYNKKREIADEIDAAKENKKKAAADYEKRKEAHKRYREYQRTIPPAYMSW